MNRDDIKARLKAIGLPQWRLAEAIPINRTTLTSWMQCTVIPKDREELIEKGLQKLEGKA